MTDDRIIIKHIVYTNIFMAIKYVFVLFCRAKQQILEMLPKD